MRTPHTRLPWIGARWVFCSNASCRAGAGAEISVVAVCKPTPSSQAWESKKAFLRERMCDGEASAAACTPSLLPLQLHWPHTFLRTRALCSCVWGLILSSSCQLRHVWVERGYILTKLGNKFFFSTAGQPQRFLPTPNTMRVPHHRTDTHGAAYVPGAVPGLWSHQSSKQTESCLKNA